MEQLYIIGGAFTLLLFILIHYSQEAEKYKELCKTLYLLDKKYNFTSQIERSIGKQMDRDNSTDVDPIASLFHNISFSERIEKLYDAIAKGEQLLNNKRA